MSKCNTHVTVTRFPCRSHRKILTCSHGQLVYADRRELSQAGRISELTGNVNTVKCSLQTVQQRSSVSYFMDASI